MGRGRSFLKWAGGKGQVADLLVDMIHEELGTKKWRVRAGQTYHEPMLGSGSMYFTLKSKGIISDNSTCKLGDINEVLMCSMQVVRDDSLLSELVKKLAMLQDEYPKDLPHPNPRHQSKKERENRMYYRKRTELNDLSMDLRNHGIHSFSDEKKIQLASLMIFLNKTCFNGLWRINSSGNFNTPEGNYNNPRNICQRELLGQCNSMLQNTELLHQDWKSALAATESEDLVYLDPPYIPLEFGGNIFNSYSNPGFTLKDHFEMAEEAIAAAERGVRIIISNHDLDGNEATKTMYGGNAKIKSLDIQRLISCKGEQRIRVKEVLVFL